MRSLCPTGLKGPTVSEPLCKSHYIAPLLFSGGLELQENGSYQVTNKMHCFNGMTDEWKELSAMPSKRTNHVAEYIDSQDVIFVHRLQVYPLLFLAHLCACTVGLFALRLFIYLALVPKNVTPDLGLAGV